MAFNHDSLSNFLQPILVYISCANTRIDEELRDELEAHLSALWRKGTINTWNARNIPAGSDRANWIQTTLNTADIILLLISADFLASNHCHDIESRHAMERNRAGSAIVIPVILRPVEWEDMPFGILNPIPSDQAITEWQNRDQAFKKVAQEIQRQVAQIHKARVRIASIALQKQIEELNEIEHGVQLRARSVEQARQTIEQSLCQIDQNNLDLEDSRISLQRKVLELREREEQFQHEITGLQQRNFQLGQQLSALRQYLSTPQLTELSGNSNTSQNSQPQPNQPQPQPNQPQPQPNQPQPQPNQPQPQPNQPQPRLNQPQPQLNQPQSQPRSRQRRARNVRSFVITCVVVGFLLVLGAYAIPQIPRFFGNNQQNGTSPISGVSEADKYISAGQHDLAGQTECPFSVNQDNFGKLKKKGITLIEEAQKLQDDKAKSKYKDASISFIKALRICSGELTSGQVDDPIEADPPESTNPESVLTAASETRIYLNNALVGAEIGNSKTYTLAVAAPITIKDEGHSPNGLVNVRGVAQRQAEVFKQRINNKLLRIILVDDRNDINLAKELADKLVNLRDDIHGLIGHQLSGIMMDVKEKYQEGGIPVISPSVTANTFSKWKEKQYVFRTAPAINIMARTLAEHVRTRTIDPAKVAIIFNANDNSNQAYSNEFRLALNALGFKGNAYAIDQKTPEEIYTQLKANQKLQAIVFVTSVTGNNKVLNNLKRLISDIAQDDRLRGLKLFGGNDIINPGFLESLEKIAQLRTSEQQKEVYVEIVTPWTEFVDVNSETRRRNNNNSFWNGANWNNVMAYDATSAFIRAMSRPIQEALLNRDAIQANLVDQQLKVEGAFKDFQFSSEGDRKNIESGNSIDMDAYMLKAVYCKKETQNCKNGFRYEKVD